MSGNREGPDFHDAFALAVEKVAEITGVRPRNCIGVVPGSNGDFVLHICSALACKHEKPHVRRGIHVSRGDVATVAQEYAQMPDPFVFICELERYPAGPHSRACVLIDPETFGLRLLKGHEVTVLYSTRSCT